jgi:uncharacterized protein (TIGR00369 family)
VKRTSTTLPSGVSGTASTPRTDGRQTNQMPGAAAGKPSPPRGRENEAESRAQVYLTGTGGPNSFALKPVWEDGVVETVYGLADPATVRSLSGLELLQKMADGEFPAAPIAEPMNFRLVEVEHGKAVFEGTPDARLLNPLGSVHGGWALTLIDSAAGCAVHTTLPAGIGYTTLETKVNFTRAIRPDGGPVRCTGTVLTAGRQIATAEARLLAADGTLLAHGTSTLMILAPRS